MEIKNQIIKKTFDIKKYNFNDIFLKHLKNEFAIDSLEELHKHIPSNLLPNNIVTVENDQHQKIYNILYQIDPGYNLKSTSSNGVFLKTYNHFVSEIAQNVFKEDLIFQNKPTLRVHFPLNRAVGGFHRDREYNHPLEEINIWVPLTVAQNTASIWIENTHDSKDHQPINLIYGEYVIFDSGLEHGNKINKEDLTRISFDFRVIPISLYNKDNENLSFDQKKKFTLGDYYSRT